jgi:hypothetical protein
MRASVPLNGAFGNRAFLERAIVESMMAGGYAMGQDTANELSFAAGFSILERRDDCDRETDQDYDRSAPGALTHSTAARISSAGLDRLSFCLTCARWVSTVLTLR